MILPYASDEEIEINKEDQNSLIINDKDIKLENSEISEDNIKNNLFPFDVKYFFNPLISLVKLC